MINDKCLMINSRMVESEDENLFNDVSDEEPVKLEDKSETEYYGPSNGF